MRIHIDEELRHHLTEIQRERKTDAGWAEIESSDMFQSPHYNGGYDATESAFCFSYFDRQGEWWFQFTIQDVERLLTQAGAEVELRHAH